MLARAAAAAARREAGLGAACTPAPPTLLFARWFAAGKDTAPTADTADAAAPSTSDASPPPPPGKGPRGRRPSRRVAGSWAVSKELEDELLSARRVPAGAHLYDMRNSFPYFYEPRGVEEVVAAIREGAGSLAPTPAPAPPSPGARPVVCWETRAVLHAGPAGADHPANRKVVARVALADLAAEAGLSEAAARHVGLVAGPRFNTHTGVLRLTAESAPDREGNVKVVERMLKDLVEEGRRVYPAGAERAE